MSPGISECWFHGNEVVPDDVFIICGECGHVWTRETLEEANYQGQVESASAPILMPFAFEEPGPPFVPTRQRAEDIFFCPECIHDF